MQPQQAILKFSDVERQIGDRLLKIALETDRVEGYSEPHAIMIAQLSETIGTAMGLHGSDLTALKFAALAHDIGERVMKRNYLLRPNTLIWEETLDLWRHPILGEQAAGELRLSRQTQLLIRWHHEWWNGLGYPDGLIGERIPLGARILRVVDSYYALTSDRPYRQRYDALEAEQIIADLAGIEFDPQVVKLLLALLAEERGEHEPELPSEPLGPESQVIFNTEDPQPVFVEAESHPASDEIDIFSASKEAESHVVELPVETRDDVQPMAENEPPEVINPEFPISETLIIDAQGESSESHPPLAQPREMTDDSDSAEIAPDHHRTSDAPETKVDNKNPI